MARIADKHGLTNKYRQVGTGKRVVRRGRPRKYLLGSPKRYSRRKSSCSVVSEPRNKSIVDLVAAFIVLSIILGVFCYFIPFFVPIVAFPVIIGVGDWFLKKKWNLPMGRWSRCASLGWVLLSSLEMVISFVCVIAMIVFEQPVIYLLVSIVLYILFSFIILRARFRKLSKST